MGGFLAHVATYNKKLALSCQHMQILKEVSRIAKQLGKNQALQFIKPQAQGLLPSTWGVVHRELVFKYRDSIRVAQSRLSEMRGRK